MSPLSYMWQSALLSQSLTLTPVIFLLLNVNSTPNRRSPVGIAGFNAFRRRHTMAKGFSPRCYEEEHEVAIFVKDAGFRTPKTHRCLNTLHPNPRVKFRTCWGHVEELLVAGELWINHKKLIFFPRSSAMTCTNRPLEVDQRRRPCERDGPIGCILSLIATEHPSHSELDEPTVAILLPDLTTPSLSSHPIVAFWSRPVVTLTRVRRDLTSGSVSPVAFFTCTHRDLLA
ncbi:hypothetical protein Taro_036857 [Colocasia esculenta]|uniref:Uncharacterized protein n=1 Tax=Colocasia esculenta TaxID=4460 RepID=A0A843WHJ4_COLES|nr:hypothetical protein [Colocasia esculenta]